VIWLLLAVARSRAWLYWPCVLFKVLGALAVLLLYAKADVVAPSSGPIAVVVFLLLMAEGILVPPASADYEPKRPLEDVSLLSMRAQ
ncbi:Hypothetical protein UVM_LOCUS62, partial [uncultured virus]